MKTLEVVNISKSYQQGDSRLQILKNLNLVLQTGSTTAIVGQSGSGKSTLLTLLAGLDHPDSGKIMVGGQDLAQLSAAQITKFRGQNIGIVFQQFHLMPHLTAIENILLPLEILGLGMRMADAEKALHAVGLTHRAQHLPQQMSGGECQRVAIARALVVRPQLLLADEPSGSLDQVTGEQVVKLLFALAHEHQSTLLLVTHNLEIARQCDRYLVLRDGMLHEETPPA